MLKLCMQSCISKRNLPSKFQLLGPYGSPDMNFLRFETSPRFAKFEKRKIAITFEILLENLQFFFKHFLFSLRWEYICDPNIHLFFTKCKKPKINITPLCGDITKMSFSKKLEKFDFMVVQGMNLSLTKNLGGMYEES